MARSVIRRQASHESRERLFGIRAGKTAVRTLPGNRRPDEAAARRPDRPGRRRQDGASLAATAARACRDAGEANRILRKILEYQDLRPGSETCGNFFWMTHWTRVKDKNAVSFLCSKLVYAYLHFPDKLEPDTRSALEHAFPAMLQRIPGRCGLAGLPGQRPAGRTPGLRPRQVRHAAAPPRRPIRSGWSRGRCSITSRRPPSANWRSAKPARRKSTTSACPSATGASTS